MLEDTEIHLSSSHMNKPMQIMGPMLRALESRGPWIAPVEQIRATYLLLTRLVQPHYQPLPWESTNPFVLAIFLRATTPAFDCELLLPLPFFTDPSFCKASFLPSATLVAAFGLNSMGGGGMLSSSMAPTAPSGWAPSPTAQPRPTSLASSPATTAGTRLVSLLIHRLSPPTATLK